MKCARLHLQQRAKGKVKIENAPLVDKPRRYCQKRLVNPAHEEDPRWIDIFDRFHCNVNNDQYVAINSTPVPQDNEDMVLTVQTLKFEGDDNQTSRPRTSFKYKKNNDVSTHRMFVKQPVSEHELTDEDRSSQLTYYYFDEYIKYLYSTDRSRPASRNSSIFLRGYTKEKENKATQVEVNTEEPKKSRKNDSKVKNNAKKSPSLRKKDEIRDVSENIEDTKITYQKTGKRKSLTISRAQSPETVQVIRVDVVCNYPNSSIPDYEDNKKVECSPDGLDFIKETAGMKKNYFANRYSNHLATKYLLTNSIKSLDENLSGGSKVTLLCKTFKLSDRNITEKPEKEKKFSRSLKNKKFRLKNNKIRHHEVVY